jgi:hypothetical protein
MSNKYKAEYFQNNEPNDTQEVNDDYDNNKFASPENYFQNPKDPHDYLKLESPDLDQADNYRSNPLVKPYKEDFRNEIDFNVVNRKGTTYRMDDTINLVRNPNLSVEADPNNPDLSDDDFRKEIEDHFGPKLLALFSQKFPNDTCRYICTSVNNCEMQYLLNHNFNDLENAQPLND